MTSFDEIYLRAVERHGEDGLAARMATPKTSAELAATPDDRYLSALAKVLFASGFRWRVVEAKWPGFEEAFHGFDPGRVAGLSAAEVGALQQDTRIIRNGPKIQSTLANARWMRQVADEHGSFAKWLAEWPEDDPVGLWDALKAGGDRLGGNTGPRFLRNIGRDTFILTDDVAGALADLGLMTGKPTGKGARRQAQEAFNAWKVETGQPYCQLSVVLACSRGEIYGD